MHALTRSVGYPLRLLARTPSYTATAVLTLGLGIGACTAIYTVVHSVLLAPLPYPSPERLVQVWQVNAQGGRSAFSDPNYEDVRTHSRSFQALAQCSGMQAVVTGGTAPVRAGIAVVSREMPQVLQIQPVIGRWFLPDEQQVGGRPAAVVTHAFWQQYLAGDADLSNRSITFDERAFTVVGVLPPGARFPLFAADVWVPRELWAPLPSRTAHNWRVIGRLAADVSVEQARADVRRIAADLKEQHGESTWMEDTGLLPLKDAIVGDSRAPLLVLLGGAAFLLLVACANVVNLLLARATARQREIAVRAALGAGRASLIGLFVIEALLLALAGSAVGLLVASTAVDAWLALEPRGLPRVDDIRVGWHVLAFAAAVAGASAAVMGLLAGWRATRQGADALKEGSRTTGSAGTARIRGGLVVVQIAISLVLLAGAGLVARSVSRLVAQDPGFRTNQLLTMELSSPRSDDAAAPARLARFHDELLARLRALPGVHAAGGVNAFPLSGAGANGRFIILSAVGERTIRQAIAACGGARVSRDMMAARGGCSDAIGRAFGLFDSEQTGDAEFRVASAAYFDTMGIPLVRGRLFDGRDGPDSPHVAVISESLAKTRWPDRDPIGLRIEYGNMDGDLTPLTIVGIVGDVRESGLDGRPQPTFYGHARQRAAAASAFTVAMHTTADPTWLMGRAREIVRELNPDVPPRFRTIDQVIGSSIADRRAMMLLLLAFAAAALLVAAIGLYGVMSYTVAQRTPEIGVRIALGARPDDVRRLVLRQAMRLTIAGIATGMVTALLSTRVLSSLLFATTPNDPPTYVGVSVLLAAVAALAALVPAVRATRVDPAVVLRSQ